MTAPTGPVGDQWEFAGWGKADRITDLETGPTAVKRLDQPVRHLLGSWRATAICGRDITSIDPSLAELRKQP